MQHAYSQTHIKNRVWNTLESPLSLIQSLMHTNSQRLRAPQLQSCVALAQVRGVVGASHFINHIWEGERLFMYIFPYVVTAYSSLT